MKKPIFNTRFFHLKKNFGHRCLLSNKDHQLTDIIPGNDCRSKLKRVLHQTFIQTEHHPRTRFYCRSHYSLFMDKMVHIKKFPTIIHPFSPFKIVWDFLMVIVNLIVLMYLSFHDAFSVHPALHIQTQFPSITRICLQLICVFDMVINFRTAYHSGDKYPVYEYKKIAENYLKTNFLWDFMSCISLITLPLRNVVGDAWTFLIWLMMVMKLARAHNLLRNIQSIGNLLHIKSKTVKFLNTFAFMLTVVHLVSCIEIFLAVMYSGLYQNKIPKKKSWFTIQGIWNSSARIIYVHAVFQTVCFLSGSASQSVAHRTIYFEMQGLCIVGWIFSRIIFAIFISLLWAALRSTFSHKIQYLNKMYTVEHFSERNQISKVLRKKLKSYYRYKYKFEIFPRVFSNIPKQMKEEMVESREIELLHKIPFLRALPKGVVISLCHKVLQDIYLPGDMITKSGEKLDSFYMLIRGTAIAYTKSGIELYHVTDGMFFGEIEILFSVEVLCTILAVEKCTVHRLSRKDFLAAIAEVSQYENIMQEMQNHIYQLVKEYNTAELLHSQSKKNKVVIDPAEILSGGKEILNLLLKNNS